MKLKMDTFQVEVIIRLNADANFNFGFESDETSEAVDVHAIQGNDFPLFTAVFDSFNAEHRQFISWCLRLNYLRR